MVLALLALAASSTSVYNPSILSSLSLLLLLLLLTSSI